MEQLCVPTKYDNQAEDASRIEVAVCNSATFGRLFSDTCSRVVTPHIDQMIANLRTISCSPGTNESNSDAQAIIAQISTQTARSGFLHSFEYRLRSAISLLSHNLPLPNLVLGTQRSIFLEALNDFPQNDELSTLVLKPEQISERRRDYLNPPDLSLFNTTLTDNEFCRALVGTLPDSLTQKLTVAHGFARLITDLDQRLSLEDRLLYIKEISNALYTIKRYVRCFDFLQQNQQRSCFEQEPVPLLQYSDRLVFALNEIPFMDGYKSFCLARPDLPYLSF